MADGRHPVLSRQRHLALAVTLFGLAFGVPAAEQAAPPPGSDPHHSAAGFFDMHVCNWPDRPMFFLILFSTTRFDEVKRIEVFRPNGSLLTELSLSHYRVIRKKDAREKRVFIEQLTLPKGAADGWYTARVTLRNGTRYSARDYVIIYAMAQVSDMKPPDGVDDIPVPSELTWAPVAGRAYYKVYIKDMWDEGKIIYESKLLDEPRLALPARLIKPGGDYVWRVQARDVNENVLLGDFNHGSLYLEARFSTAR